MLIAQRDLIGEYVERRGAEGPELDRIIAHNLATYEKELARVRKSPHAIRCVYCLNLFEARSANESIQLQMLCLLCRELALWATPFLQRIRERENLRRIVELHEQLAAEIEDDEDDEENA